MKRVSAIAFTFLISVVCVTAATGKSEKQERIKTAIIDGVKAYEREILHYYTADAIEDIKIVAIHSSEARVDYKTVHGDKRQSHYLHIYKAGRERTWSRVEITR